MSYAEQIGDKFYFTPRDCKPGDENFIHGNWQVCNRCNGTARHIMQPRRRLIAPGAGYRILGVDEVLPTKYEYCKSDLVWKYTKNLAQFEVTVGFMVQQFPDVLATRIPVDAGKEQMLGAENLSTHGPIFTKPVPVENNTGHKCTCSVCKQGERLYYITAKLSGDDREWLESFYDYHINEMESYHMTKAHYKDTVNQPIPPRIQRVIDAARDYYKMVTNFITPSIYSPKLKSLESALADLGETENHDTTDFPQKPCRQCGKKDRPQYDGTCNDDHCAHYEPSAQDELQVLLELINDKTNAEEFYQARCAYGNVQRWIEEAMQKRNAAKGKERGL